MPEPYELVWAESARLLARQEASLDTLRVRALGVLSAGGIITGIFGAREEAAPWAVWVALASLALSAMLTVWICWPRSFDFAHEIDPMLERVRHQDVEEVSALDVAYNWARDLNDSHKDNEPKLARLVNAYTAMCFLLAVEVVAAVGAVTVAA